MNFFSDQAPAPSQAVIQNTNKQSWCVLLVDDEEEIHSVTRLALRGFEFQGRPLELLSAYSAMEARVIFSEHEDIALALIDVVMENDHAGLDLVRYLRDDCCNTLTRLVLRTGQAGQAPEDRVIREYGIDDYKEKTELTTQKLRTLLYSMLRSYRDLRVIEEQRQGLSNVIKASARVQNAATLQVFSSVMLEQLTSLLHLNRSALYCMVLPQTKNHDRMALALAATGEFLSYSSGSCFEDLPDIVSCRFKEALSQQQSLHFNEGYVMYMRGGRGGEYLLYITHDEPLSNLDKQLLELYIYNAALTLENINLMEDIQETSKELVCTLADAVEARSKETGAHVQRVALVSELLANLAGLEQREVILIKHASPLHDIGKVAIPDAILHKPGKLNDIEWALMKKHVDYGVSILQSSKRELMQVGAIIAGNHHERWDGKGYPQGLVAEEIPIAGRIVALADVFDALGSSRSYKQPWADDRIYDFIASERGGQFDPLLTDLLLANYSEFRLIRERFPDKLSGDH